MDQEEGALHLKWAGIWVGVVAVQLGEDKGSTLLLPAPHTLKVTV
jgi:hypothetical protein